MMYGFAWAAALALVLLGAAPSHAGIVIADLDLSGSQLNLAGVTVADGSGATVSGTARVVLMVDGQGPPGGPIVQPSLSGLDLTFDIRAPVPGLDATLSGPVRIRQLGFASPAGTFDGMTLLIPEASFNAELSAVVDCAGSQCNVISAVTTIMLPIVVSRSLSNMGQPFSFAVGGFGSGNLRLDSVFSSMGSGAFFNVSLQGRQVPEPRELGLLLLGVLAVSGGVALRRLQTR